LPKRCNIPNSQNKNSLSCPKHASHLRPRVHTFQRDGLGRNVLLCVICKKKVFRILEPHFFIQISLAKGNCRFWRFFAPVQHPKQCRLRPSARNQGSKGTHASYFGSVHFIQVIFVIKINFLQSFDTYIRQQQFLKAIRSAQFNQFNYHYVLAVSPLLLIILIYIHG
jgi:hypothetical protein